MSECNLNGNTGNEFCGIGSIEGNPIGFAFATKDFNPTEADALLYATWLTAIQEREIFPVIVPNYEFTDSSEETQYHEFANGTRKKRREGKYRLDHLLNVNDCLNKQLREFDGWGGKLILFYEDNIIAMTTDGTNVEGAQVSLSSVNKRSLPMTDGTPSNVMVNIDLKSHKDLNEYSFIRQVEWDIEDLQGLTPVTVAASGTPTSTEVILTINAVCGGNSLPITGIAAEAGSFSVATGGSVSTVTDNGDGSYTLAGTGFVAGDYDLVDPETRTDDILVISSGAATVTI